MTSDLVDEVGDESFPASDAPAWTGLHAGLVGRPADETILDAHLAARNAHDLDAVMAGYADAPLMVVNGRRVEGRDAIRAFLRGLAAAFSELRIEERARHRARGAERAVVVEQTLRGRHAGPWGALAATGRAFEVPVCTVYVIDARGQIEVERAYFDAGSVERQLRS